MPMAPSVPITPASATDHAASTRLFLSASPMSELASRRSYHIVVKPCHAPIVRPALNE